MPSDGGMKGSQKMPLADARRGWWELTAGATTETFGHVGVRVWASVPRRSDGPSPNSTT